MRRRPAPSVADTSSVKAALVSLDRVGLIELGEASLVRMHQMVQKCTLARAHEKLDEGELRASEALLGRALGGRRRDRRRLGPDLPRLRFYCVAHGADLSEYLLAASLNIKMRFNHTKITRTGRCTGGSHI